MAASKKAKVPAKDDPRRRANGQIVKGVRPGKGRQRGTPNKRTALLKDAILQAAALVGQDGKGKDGLIGYLMMLATKERAVYSRLLEKVLPLQLHVKEEDGKKYTAAEAIERLKDRGIPVPPSLTSLAGQRGLAAVANGLNDQYGIGDPYDNRMSDIALDYEAELNGEDAVSPTNQRERHA